MTGTAGGSLPVPKLGMMPAGGRTITELVGNTPLLRIGLFQEKYPDLEVYAKAEWFNPGGSVKDRAALAMIEDGERRGVLTRERTITQFLPRVLAV